MRWGIVGAGLHADQRIVPALAKTGTERLHGVVGSSEAAATAFAQRTRAARAYATIEALVADPAVDAVFITTPNDQHRRQTEIAVAAGKHVLVEKPMALSEADCRAMIEAARKANVRLGVGFQARHHPVHRAMRELVTAGELGEVVLVRGEWHSSYGPWKNWRADPRRAGSDVLGAIGVHVLDLVCWLAGAEVREVSALIDRSPETRQDQTIACTLAFANGAIGTATFTRRAAWPLNSISVWGTKGTASGVGTLGMSPSGLLRRSIGQQVTDTTLAVPDLYAAQFEAFAAAVARGDEPTASGADGLRSAQLAERILRSG
jgi:1,5-anhydro-D-fructose reductase (1,5-anhydro-D-mannitol-forming)